MLFFCHLLTGITFGILLYFLFRDKRVILITAFGSILPDLIDKPLGHIIFAESLGFGRIIFHGFWVMLIFLILGIFFYYKYKNPLLLSLGIGVLLHHMEDCMWIYPQNWFWPALGPYYVKDTYDDYFLRMILVEITSPEEFFCLILIFIGVVVYFLWKKNYI